MNLLIPSLGSNTGASAENRGYLIGNVIIVNQSQEGVEICAFLFFVPNIAIPLHQRNCNCP